MKTSTVLSKQIDNKTIKNLWQSSQDKKRKRKVKKAAKTDMFLIFYITRSTKTLGLIKIQIEVKDKKFQFIGEKVFIRGSLIGI